MDVGRNNLAFFVNYEGMWDVVYIVEGGSVRFLFFQVVYMVFLFQVILFNGLYLVLFLVLEVGFGFYFRIQVVVGMGIQFVQRNVKDCKVLIFVFVVNGYYIWVFLVVWAILVCLKVEQDDLFVKVG